MLASALRIVLPVALAGALGVPSAHADIYTWVDAKGSINVSNLQPPDDARVIKVTKDSAPPAAPDAQTQTLTDRVRQLEALVAMRPMPPPGDYAPPLVQYVPPPAQSTPTVVQYFVESAPQQPQYAPPQYYGPQYDSTDYWAGNYTGNWAGNTWCDPNWLNCGWGPYGWAPGFYPPSVVIVNNPKRGRPGNGFNFGHRPPTRPPIVSPFTTNPVAPLTMSLPQMGTSLNTSMNARRPPASPRRG